MRAAAIAAAVTGLAGYPRLWLWTDRTHALWFMVTLLVLTSFVLWTFVFGWYRPGTGQSAWRLPLSFWQWFVTVLAGMLGAVLIALALDPRLRTLHPDDYPHTLAAWLPAVLFTVVFGQLFTCYAPLCLFLRLFRNPAVAVFLTVIFGQFLLGLQLKAASVQADLEFAMWLHLCRALLGCAGAMIFLRGGLVAGTVWALLLEVRLLFTVDDAPFAR
jgi:hypothetical protein